MFPPWPEAPRKRCEGSFTTLWAGPHRLNLQESRSDCSEDSCGCWLLSASTSVNLLTPSDSRSGAWEGYTRARCELFLWVHVKPLRAVAVWPVLYKVLATREDPHRALFLAMRALRGKAAKTKAWSSDSLDVNSCPRLRLLM